MNQHARNRFSVIVSLLLALAAAGALAAGPAPSPPAVSNGANHYVIDSAASDVRFLVYRAGLLAAFGHNHVVRAMKMSGAIDAFPNDFSRSGFRLRLPVADFRVDARSDRDREGKDFRKQPSAKDIAATRHNMLSHVLDATRYPDVAIRSVSVAGSPQKAQLGIRITLHGTSRELNVPVHIKSGSGRLVATGEFTILQTDFGMTPYHALAGGLRVKNRVGVRFRIVANLAPKG